MRVEYINRELTGNEKEQIKEILYESDYEFYPPLSARISSSQKDLKDIDTNISKNSAGPLVYYNEMIQQEFIIAYEEEKVIAFMTFKKDYICDALKDFGKSLYITTVCVRKEERGKGVLSSLYDCMECEVVKHFSFNKVSTRTWSLNEKQIHSLENRHYKLLKLLENDRGNGVDTLYYGIIV